jgi:hypothetical protein
MYNFEIILVSVCPSWGIIAYFTHKFKKIGFWYNYQKYKQISEHGKITLLSFDLKLLNAM